MTVGSNKRTCPKCGGIIQPARRGQDPDQALARHIALTHPGAA